MKKPHQTQASFISLLKELFSFLLKNAIWSHSPQYDRNMCL